MPKIWGKPIKKLYGDKWITILYGRVVEVVDGLQSVARRVQARDDRDCLVIQYISEKPVAMFFQLGCMPLEDQRSG